MKNLFETNDEIDLSDDENFLNVDLTNTAKNVFNNVSYDPTKSPRNIPAPNKSHASLDLFLDDNDDAFFSQFMPGETESHGSKSVGELTTVCKTIPGEKRRLEIAGRQCARKKPKFPGPAGHLPKLSNSKQELLMSPVAATNKRLLTPLTPKTSPRMRDEDFSLSIWREIHAHTTTFHAPLSTISDVITSDRPAKVALLCVLVKSFTASSGKLVLKDPSGDINATVHKHVLEEHEQDLRQGTGLLLRDVSVYSPSPKKHYVNITPANIAYVVCAEANETYAQTQLSQIMRDENITMCQSRSKSVKDVTNLLNDVTATPFVNPF